jgi:hypothetical protein
MTQSTWTNPPSLLDIDLLLMKLQQRAKPVLSFQYTLDGLPWQAVLEKHDDGHTTLAVMLELAALPFTGEDASRRLLTVTLMQALNLHWQRQSHDLCIGLSPRRNTVFLVHRATFPGIPDLVDLLSYLGQQAVIAQAPLKVIQACAPWLLKSYKKISSLQRI